MHLADNIIVDGIFRAVDPRFEPIVGASASSLVGMETLRFVHPESQELARTRIQTIANGGVVLPTRFKLVDTGGRKLDALLSSKLITVHGRPATVNRCRILTGPECDMETVCEALETARSLERTGQFGAAATALGDAMRLLCSDCTPAVGVTALMQLGELLENCGYRMRGRRIKDTTLDLLRELGLRTARPVGPSPLGRESSGSAQLLLPEPRHLRPRQPSRRARILQFPTRRPDRSGGPGR